MLALIWKDIVLEARTRETLPTLLVLGVLILVVFYFSLALRPQDIERMAAGILWIGIVFASVLALGRSFMIERDGACIEGLLTSPMDRGSIFLGKLAVNVILLLAFEALLLPMFALLFGVNLLANLPGLILVLVAGTVGLAATGTLFALAALGTRAREMVLPLLVLPLQVPLLIAAVQATEMVLGGAGILTLGARATLLAAFDILFVTSGWLLFEFVLLD
ncbi:MAG TPA: heme exporter protein CcmB [Candidatus Limnocylindrales bacterium]|nr:heme exporter protein CcmB [Candidatus Limnocylindrales bacterium]